MPNFKASHTPDAPQPTGAYSQAIQASGPFLFVSGQTPRLPNGKLLVGASIGEQTKRVLENIQAIAQSSGLELRDTVFMTVYLSDLKYKKEFEEVYSTYFNDPLPARIVVQSSFTAFDVEISAQLQRKNHTP